MLEPVVDIVIPTWNLPEYFDPCVSSIIRTDVLHSGFCRLIVVNNGKQPIESQYRGTPNLKVLSPGENLGWEGGLKLGLEHSTAKFVCFQNDDTFLPPTSYLFYEKMLIPFNDRNVAAVGPITTVASGIQSVFSASLRNLCDVRWLIFFTVMLRREHLDEAGGIDTSLPGGDDFDLSIRLRQHSKKLLVQPAAFILHHGFKTGTRLHGDHTSNGGWNSSQMRDRTNTALIRKHGFRTFFETLTQQVIPSSLTEEPDLEGTTVRSMLSVGKKVIEIGCGARKTIESAIGVDQTPAGEQATIYHGHCGQSVADIVVDVTKPLPFHDNEFDVVVARHILEHCVDSVSAIRNWSRILKPGGRMIIAVPDEDLLSGIPLSPDHCHAFNSKSLKSLMETLGFEEIESRSAGNGISFVGCYQKISVASIKTSGGTSCITTSIPTFAHINS